MIGGDAEDPHGRLSLVILRSSASAGLSRAAFEGGFFGERDSHERGVSSSRTREILTRENIRGLLSVAWHGKR